jgi:hypothetical protein
VSNIIPFVVCVVVVWVCGVWCVWCVVVHVHVYLLECDTPSRQWAGHLHIVCWVAIWPLASKM